MICIMLYLSTSLSHDHAGTLIHPCIHPSIPTPPSIHPCITHPPSRHVSAPPTCFWMLGPTQPDPQQYSLLMHLHEANSETILHTSKTAATGAQELWPQRPVSQQDCGGDVQEGAARVQQCPQCQELCGVHLRTRHSLCPGCPWHIRPASCTWSGGGNTPSLPTEDSTNNSFCCLVLGKTPKITCVLYIYVFIYLSHVFCINYLLVYLSHMFRIFGYLYIY